MSGGVYHGSKGEARSALATCAFLAWQCLYPLYVCSALLSNRSRLMVAVPRTVHMFVLHMAYAAASTPSRDTLIEQALFLFAFGAGCLAHYISCLTRRIARQNAASLENGRLRRELHASLSAMTESAEHIAQLKRLVGASASEGRRSKRSLTSDRCRASCSRSVSTRPTCSSWR